MLRLEDDRLLADLVGELTLKYPEFSEWWYDHRVLATTHGAKQYRHPLVGDRHFAYESFQPVGDTDQTLCVYNAEPGSETTQALQLLTSWTAPQPTRPPSEPRAGHTRGASAKLQVARGVRHEAPDEYRRARAATQESLRNDRRASPTGSREHLVLGCTGRQRCRGPRPIRGRAASVVSGCEMSDASVQCPSLGKRSGPGPGKARDTPEGRCEELSHGDDTPTGPRRLPHHCADPAVGAVRRS
ncbi:hypothetical protein Q3A86_00055 [Streptomyces sp. NBUA17]|uniref:MmyB family transcriptional regulator n=1 Tax=Streptomyces sp. NBUA17 TaxID=3062275 RepID=UPI0037DA4743